jgi:tetratricopeptide (TPR) repeat protein
MQSSIRQNWGQVLVIFLVILVCIGAIARLQIPQMQQIQTQSQNASIQEIHRQVEAEKLRLTLLQKVPTFGFDNLVADWTFLSFLQYFGDEAARKKSDYRLSPDYFEIILKHNPNFLQVYPFLSTSAALYAGMPERSTAIMQQALKSLNPSIPPGSYSAWRQLAIDQLLFLGDAQAAIKSFETAAKWARAASSPGGDRAAEFSQRTADFLAKNPNSKTAQVAVWTMVLGNAPDDRTRQIAINRIKGLGGKILESADGSFQVQPPAKD